MRTIKFRGQRVDWKGWAYGSLLLPTTDNTTTRIIGWNGTRFEVIPETVGQFTGLTDKNGVEIYEGDLVYCNMAYNGKSIPHAGTIIYSDVFGAFATKNEGGETLLHNHLLNTFEVKENIHNNPVLLK